MMIYDLSHHLVTGMPHFPGDFAPRVETIPETAPWRVSRLHLSSHSGTHIDVPRYYIADGKGIGAYTSDRFIRTGLLIDAGGAGDNDPLGVDILAPYAALIQPGSIIVLRTGWERHWSTARYFDHPYLGPELAAALIAYGVSLVGIDTPNIDSTPGAGEEAHGLLLGADILIVENLCGLDVLALGVPYIFACIPLAVGEIDGAPVRALAWEPTHQFQ